MIDLSGVIHRLSPNIKWFIAIFLVVLSVGYFTGLSFVKETSGMNPVGIEENYVGNEDDLEAEEMKFKKSEREMLNIIHTHILSMSIIFLILGFFVSLTSLPQWLKKNLMFEPLLSVLLTFGGIYMIWSGSYWFTCIVMISGILMTLSFVFSVLLVLWQMLFYRA